MLGGAAGEPIPSRRDRRATVQDTPRAKRKERNAQAGAPDFPSRGDARDTVRDLPTIPQVSEPWGAEEAPVPSGEEAPATPRTELGSAEDRTDTVLDTPTVPREDAGRAPSEPPVAPDTAPNLELPIETVAEVTMPSVVLPEAASGEAPVGHEPSIVVDPSMLQPPTRPVEPPMAAAAPSPPRRAVGEETVELVAPPARSTPRTAALLGVGAALFVVGGAVAAFLWLRPDASDDGLGRASSVAAASADEAPPSRPEPDAADAPDALDEAAVRAEADPSPAGEPSEAAEMAEANPALPTDEESEEPTDDAAAGDGTDEAPELDDPDALESYELELPRLSRRARRMSPAQRRRHAAQLRNVALRRYRRGEFAESEATFRQVLELAPRDAAAFEGLARALAQQSRYPEALAWARQAVERNPSSGTAHRVLGDVWNQAGHPERAREAYRRGLARNPRDRWLRQRLRELR